MVRNLTAIILNIFTYLVHPPGGKSPPTWATALPPPLHQSSPHSPYAVRPPLPLVSALGATPHPAEALTPGPGPLYPSLPTLCRRPPPGWAAAPSPGLQFNTSHRPQKVRLMAVEGTLSTHLPLAKIKRIIRTAPPRQKKKNYRTFGI